MSVKSMLIFYYMFYKYYFEFIHIRIKKKKMPTASSVPRRSPIQVLTGLNIAWLQWSDENWYVQCDMAVGEK